MTSEKNIKLSTLIRTLDKSGYEVVEILKVPTPGNSGMLQIKIKPVAKKEG